MLDTDHYLQWDPRHKGIVGFFALFVRADKEREKFYSFPASQDIRHVVLKSFFKELAVSYQ